MITPQKLSKTVLVEENNSGQRLDNYLIRITKRQIPRSKIHHMIRSGEVRVNKSRCSARTRLATGDFVRIPPLSYAKREENPHFLGSIPHIPKSIILYEDSDLVALNKPSGIPCHGGSGVAFGLIEHIRTIRKDEKFIELAHRLDRDTSGIVLMAKKRTVLIKLHELFRDHTIDKRYVALVHGRWRNTFQRIQKPLYTRRNHNEKKTVVDTTQGRDSCTEIFLIARNETQSLLEAKPLSGRTHQIRVHLSSVGHPIVGDSKYGHHEEGRGKTKTRLFLHAHYLSFLHPVTKKKIAISCPLPDNLSALLEEKTLCTYEKIDERTIFPTQKLVMNK